MFKDSGYESRSLVLLTELFPPFVGGSALLFENVYSRLKDRETVVLTDDLRSAGEDEKRGPLLIRHGKLRHQNWGVLRASGLLHHLRVANSLRKVSRGASQIHCARTLPEGMAAMVCRVWGGPPYVCWAHGEDLTMQVHTSREMRILTKSICRFAKAMFANSRFTADLIADLGVPSDKIFVVHPGVDIERFHPSVDGSAIRKKYTRPGQSMLLSVGRLQRRKGFDLVIKAMSLLANDGADIRYVMVGDGPDREYLESLIDQYRLDDRVTMVGRVSDDLLPQYYAACDMFVHPNRVEGVDVEGFGLVFLEAAASGKPAIGGSSGGVPEAVLDGETGCLVSGTDERELAVTVKRLLDAPEEAQALGDTGQKRVVEEFSWDRIALEMDQVLRLLEGAV